MKHFAAAAAAGVVGVLLATTPVFADDLDKYGATKVCSLPKNTLDEISGMATSQRHPGILWVHNDSGGGPYVYALDSATCDIKARLTVEGIRARDLEAIAVGRDERGRSVIWLADIGDNQDSWEYVQVHRIREPAKLVDQVVDSVTFDITYPDRSHNAETLLADPDSSQLWIVTKQLARGRMYALPPKLSEDGLNQATFVRRERGLITDGAVSPDGTRYVLRDYVDATVFAGLPPGKNPRIVQMPFQIQGEAVAWTSDGSALLIASERDRRLIRIPVVEAAAAVGSLPSATTQSVEESNAQVVEDPVIALETSDGPGWWLAIAIGVLVAALIGVGMSIRAARRG